MEKYIEYGPIQRFKESILQMPGHMFRQEWDDFFGEHPA